MSKTLGPLAQLNNKYFERRHLLLWASGDSGDADPRLPETRVSLTDLNQIRFDAAYRIARASGAEQARELAKGLRDLETVLFKGAPKSTYSGPLAWGRTAGSVLKVRFNNPTDTDSGLTDLGYIFPQDVHDMSGNWTVTCAEPTTAPTYGALEFSIKAKAGKVASMLVGTARTDTIKITVRNYAGPAVLSVAVSGLGVQPSE